MVRQTDPKKPNVGDNITFMRGAGTSVTHQIVAIDENYQNSGARGFTTKGVNNVNADRDTVYETDIAGKVVFSVPVLGAAISYLGTNVHLVFIMFVLFMILSLSLRGLFDRPARRAAVKTA